MAASSVWERGGRTERSTGPLSTRVRGAVRAANGAAAATATGAEPKLGQSRRIPKRAKPTDIEEAAIEDLPIERDLKSEMDRAVRIAEANAEGHHLFDDSPEDTPGGLDEVELKTDQDLIRRGLARHHRRSLMKELELEEENLGPEDDDANDLEALVSRASAREEDADTDDGLAYDDTAFGTMNEEDARESGYLKEYDKSHSHHVRVTRDGVEKDPADRRH